MPKLKTNSSTKKRFKATGKLKKNLKGKSISIVRGSTGKRHGMVKKSNRQLRNNRGTKTACTHVAKTVVKLMPYIKKNK